MGVKLVINPGWEAQVNLEAHPALVRITEVVALRVRANLSRHVRTGNTLRSVRQLGTKVYVGGAWPFLEYGVRPHIITAGPGKILTDGVTVFGKRVNHPGHSAYRSISSALEGLESLGFGFRSLGR